METVLISDPHILAMVFRPFQGAVDSSRSGTAIPTSHIDSVFEAWTWVIA